MPPRLAEHSHVSCSLAGSRASANGGVSESQIAVLYIAAPLGRRECQLFVARGPIDYMEQVSLPQLALRVTPRTCTIQAWPVPEVAMIAQENEQAPDSGPVLNGGSERAAAFDMARLPSCGEKVAAAVCFARCSGREPLGGCLRRRTKNRATGGAQGGRLAALPARVRRA